VLKTKKNVKEDRASDSLSKHHWFDLQQFHFDVMILDKLFTHICLRQRAVFATGQCQVCPAAGKVTVGQADSNGRGL